MNNEIDREAMLIYLNDLRVMETIVKSDKQKYYLSVISLRKRK